MRQAFTSIEMAFESYSRDVARVAENAQLGDLAHVDAGKTTLTERLLFDSGVIDQLGKSRLTRVYMLPGSPS